MFLSWSYNYGYDFCLFSKRLDGYGLVWIITINRWFELYFHFCFVSKICMRDDYDGFSLPLFDFVYYSTPLELTLLYPYVFGMSVLALRCQPIVWLHLYLCFGVVNNGVGIALHFSSPLHHPLVVQL